MGFSSVMAAGLPTVVACRASMGKVVGKAAWQATAALLLLAGSHAHAADDASAGEVKAYTCLGCHGVEHYVNTYPSYHVPRIAGQHADYLVAALQAYRAKTRSHPTMQANAALLSDEDIQDIAAWFAAQGASN